MKCSTSLCIGMALSCWASAQSDAFFPKVEGSWHVRHYDYHGWPVWIQDWYYEYMDSTVVLQDDSLSWRSMESYTIGQPEVIFAAQDEKLYARFIEWDGDTGQVSLIYDYSANVGDTVYPGEEWPWSIAVVEGIDTVFAAGRERRHFVLSNGDEWIAGIGSLQGLFRPVWGTFEDSYELVSFCGTFMRDDGTTYLDCWPNTQSLNENEELEMIIYPDPCFGSFTIRSGTADGYFVVQDVRGAEIIRGTIRSTETLVDLPLALPGMYVIEVNGQRAKLVIQ